MWSLLTIHTRRVEPREGHSPHDDQKWDQAPSRRFGMLLCWDVKVGLRHGLILNHSIWVWDMRMDLDLGWGQHCCVH